MATSASYVPLSLSGYNLGRETFLRLNTLGITEHTKFSIVAVELWACKFIGEDRRLTTSSMCKVANSLCEDTPAYRCHCSDMQGNLGKC